MTRLCAVIVGLFVLAFAGRAEALIVTYDLNSNQGPITLRVEADDALADTRIRYRQGVADISSLLDFTLVFGGTEYTLIGAADDDEGLLDRNARTVSFVVAEVTRPFADTLTTVSLTFSARMNRLRTIGELFAYFERAEIVGGQLTISPAAAAVPLPGAAWLFAVGIGGIAAARRRPVKV